MDKLVDSSCIYTLDIEAYIQRIGYEGPLATTPECLKRLHKCHVMSIPFESLDIQLGRTIELVATQLFEKVVLRKRGGYCYELNYLFHSLLRNIGFESHLISASIYDNDKYGHEYDHMAIVVKLDHLWLVDVGYGDLFIEPITIQPDLLHADYFKYYKIERSDHDTYILYESLKRKNDYRTRYKFQNLARTIKEFDQQNRYKQNSANSYFVKNRICTIPTITGRKTIMNDTYKVKDGDQVSLKTIKNSQELNYILESEFNITL